MRHIKRHHLVILVGAIILGALAIYLIGYQQGKNQVPSPSNHRTSTRQNPLFSSLSASQVTEIKGNNLTVAINGKQIKHVKLNSKTAVSGKDGKLTIGDLKTGSNIILFTREDGDQLVATRIVVQ